MRNYHRIETFLFLVFFLNRVRGKEVELIEKKKVARCLRIKKKLRYSSQKFANNNSNIFLFPSFVINLVFLVLF